MLQTVEALQIAEDQGLDLVEVSPNATPPVCKIQDYGKFKYEQSKRAATNAKQHKTQLKEIRLRPKTGDNDINFKIKHARDFLEGKDKVKFTIVFKGRELAHQDRGREILHMVIDSLDDIAKVEKAPSHEGGRQIFIILAPR